MYGSYADVEHEFTVLFHCLYCVESLNDVTRTLFIKSFNCWFYPQNERNNKLTIFAVLPGFSNWLTCLDINCFILQNKQSRARKTASILACGLICIIKTDNLKTVFYCQLMVTSDHCIINQSRVDIILFIASCLPVSQRIKCCYWFFQFGYCWGVVDEICQKFVLE